MNPEDSGQVNLFRTMLRAGRHPTNFSFPFNSSGVTPTAVESDDNVSSLNFTVLNSEAAKRISSGSSSTSDHDLDKDSYEEQTKLIRKQVHNKPTNESTTYDFRYCSTEILIRCCAM